MQEFAKLTLSLARKKDMFVVLDADALFLVGKDPDIIKGYAKAVLTPNIVEFKRLSEALVCSFLNGCYSIINIESSISTPSLIQANSPEFSQKS